MVRPRARRSPAPVAHRTPAGTRDRHPSTSTHRRTPNRRTRPPYHPGHRRPLRCARPRRPGGRARFTRRFVSVASPRIRAVFFDIGETLVDETRPWGLWADWLGVPHLTFFAALGAVIARREHHRRVFDLVRPGLD